MIHEFFSVTEPLETSQCSCKGQLAIVHRRCLIEWVRYKGSNKCEICGGTFRGIPSPPRDTLGLNDLEVHCVIFFCIKSKQIINQSK